ncbi:Uncharacterised protein [Salmonella enterica subsp. enterica]|nr:Uncharacterised protein [Salmonella enterica subsp. enterica]
MKVSLAALRINAMPATIQTCFKRRYGWPQSAEGLPRREIFIVMHSKNQHLLK